MFDPQAYGSEVAHLLSLADDGRRLMPLARASCASSEARDRIGRSSLPNLVRAGLYLYFSCWQEAHELAQEIETPDGSYWHAIVHRQEPDPGNAGYWFRRVGAHPIYPALCRAAAEAGYQGGPRWDPIAFVDYCERARPGSAEEAIALQVQRAEWQLLFDHCARRAKPAGPAPS